MKLKLTKKNSKKPNDLNLTDKNKIVISDGSKYYIGYKDAEFVSLDQYWLFYLQWLNLLNILMVTEKTCHF